MRLVGIVLVVLGIAGLVAGGINYTRRHEKVELGPVSISVRERETNPVPPILGGVALLVGMALLAAGERRRN